MKSKQVNHKRKSWQRTSHLEAKHYTQGSGKSLESDEVRNFQKWSERLKMCRKQDKALKRSFAENWNWYDIGVYIVKMLKRIKNEITK